ncbi:MAG: ketoacyl-ACP synthase III [Deltaproteobacteria bacterium]|nr:ketoacyl-ACP synthase III [Deltaproteobacteria bacterium]
MSASDRDRLAVRPLGSRILGTGHAVPTRVVTNADLQDSLQTTDKWIRERTGIRERHIASPEEPGSVLATRAARHALETAGIAAEDLDLIVVGTFTPDYPMPATAVLVQRALGASCAAFDLSAACAGFVYGLSIADQFVSRGTARYALVIGVELLSHVTDWTDRSTAILFGDGAGAVVVGPTSAEDVAAGRGILSTHLFADGAHAESLIVPGGGTREPITAANVGDRRVTIKMQGKEVFKHAVRSLASSCRSALAAHDLAPKDVDWVVAHQANLRILEGVAERNEVSMDRFYVNLDRFGNTSSASIPIALDEAVRNGAIQRGQLLVLCALGGGLTWGCALVRW